MMRITGGEQCGREVTVPRAGVRPTQDRVREALFSMLAAVIPGCRFLDLYAGSGSVGLEAVSRGAAAVVWVEQDAAVYRMLRDNVVRLVGSAGTQLGGGCVRRDVPAFLRGRPAAPFDIVFADPPYAEAAAAQGGYSLADRLLATLGSGGWLAPGGIVVIETAVGAAGPPPTGWSLIRERTYGKTVLSLYKEREH